MDSRLSTTKSIMRSLHNLTCPLGTFVLSEGQREEILSEMTKCCDCNKWQYNVDIVGSICTSCAAGEPVKSMRSIPKAMRKVTSATDAPEVKRDLCGSIYSGTLFSAIKFYLEGGKTLEYALREIGISTTKYRDNIPRSSRMELTRIKKEATQKRKLGLK